MNDVWNNEIWEHEKTSGYAVKKINRDGNMTTKDAAIVIHTQTDIKSMIRR